MEKDTTTQSELEQKTMFICNSYKDVDMQKEQDCYKRKIAILRNTIEIQGELIEFYKSKIERLEKELAIEQKRMLNIVVVAQQSNCGCPECSTRKIIFRGRPKKRLSLQP